MQQAEHDHETEAQIGSVRSRLERRVGFGISKGIWVEKPPEARAAAR